jgi:hypothetical protein
MVFTPEDDDPKFNGSNWQVLNRVVALSRFAFAQDDDYDDNEGRRIAHLAQRYEGPALDWVASHGGGDPGAMGTFDEFVIATREAFGVADNNITALIRRELDQLTWQTEVPVFFAEFDRLTSALLITSHETRCALVEQKLNATMKARFAEQGLTFSNYETMRERCNLMWALDPTRNKAATQGRKKPRCGSCGKKGHIASDCRKAKN